MNYATLMDGVSGRFPAKVIERPPEVISRCVLIAR